MRSLLIALLMWTGRASAEDGTSMGLSYPLGPGDEVELEVVGETTMSGTFRVGPDGAVEVPFAGRVPVAGFTVEEATRALTAHLGSTVLRRPQVVLRVARAASREVEVSGGVSKPGMYPLADGVVTVRALVVRAGGLLDLSATRAEIHRDAAGGTRTVVEVDLERIYKGDPGADVPLQPGDRVYVPPPASVYVDGQVAKPGALAYRDGMTILQAIAQAGSATTTAKTKGVYILRGNEKIDVNVKRIQRGDAPDVELRPNDRIVVPQNPF
jgi:polysaccharide export outer membrane protein